MTSTAANHHREIERRFLIENIPFALETFPLIAIQQGYIARQPVVRLRSENSAQFFLTIKNGDAANHEEWEIALTGEQFSTLWPLAKPHSLCKLRHRIPWQQYVLEVDLFLGRLQGLCIAEVEFPDEASMALFEQPEWFGREITGDSFYSNINLAKS